MNDRANPDGLRFLELPVDVQCMILQYCLVAKSRVRPMHPKPMNPPFISNPGYASCGQVMPQPLDLSPALLRTSKHINSVGCAMLYGINEFVFISSPLMRDGMSVRTFRRRIGYKNAALIRKAFVGANQPRYTAKCPQRLLKLVDDNLRRSHVPQRVLHSFANLRLLTIQYANGLATRGHAVIADGPWGASFETFTIKYGPDGNETAVETFSGNTLRAPSMSSAGE